MRILLVEDDVTLNKNISDALIAEGYVVENYFDGSLAERKMEKNNYDCIILDVNLPGKNGFQLCESFRTYNKFTPVIILTAFADLEDKVTGFNCGADDYITKPFYMRELLLRINKLISLNTAAANRFQQEIRFDDIRIDVAKKKVFRQQQEIDITPREYQILLQLIRTPEEVISKKQLVETIWGSAVHFNTNTIEVYINFLRNKLDKPFGKNSIKTKKGYGYYIERS